MEFKSPSKNDLLLPAILFFLSWLFQNALVLFAARYTKSIYAMFMTMGGSVVLWSFNIFALIILLSYLLTKKFKVLLISVGLCLIVGVLTVVIDQQLAPFKTRMLMKNLAQNTQEQMNAGQNGQQVRYYGDSPRTICQDKKTTDGLYLCQECACPRNINSNAYELASYDGVASCNEMSGAVRTGVRTLATCSELKASNERK